MLNHPNSEPKRGPYSFTLAWPLMIAYVLHLSVCSEDIVFGLFCWQPGHDPCMCIAGPASSVAAHAGGLQGWTHRVGSVIIWYTQHYHLSLSTVR